jgi:hypothetical protein
MTVYSSKICWAVGLDNVGLDRRNPAADALQKSNGNATADLETSVTDNSLYLRVFG